MTRVHPGVELLADLPAGTTARDCDRLLEFVLLHAPAFQQLAMNEIARLQLAGRIDDEQFRTSVAAIAEADPREWVEQHPLAVRLKRRARLRRTVRALFGWPR